MKLVWNATPLCIMWTIWRERNSCTFNGVELAIIELKPRFLRLLFKLSQNIGTSNVKSVVGFIDALSFCM